MKRLESALERQCKARCKQLDLLCIKLWPFGAVGIPDRLILAKGGMTLFLELKTENGRLTKRQEAWQARLQNYGFTTTTIYGQDDLIVKLRNFAALSGGGGKLPR